MRGRGILSIVGCLCPLTPVCVSYLPHLPPLPYTGINLRYNHPVLLTFTPIQLLPSLSPKLNMAAAASWALWIIAELPCWRFPSNRQTRSGEVVPTERGGSVFYNTGGVQDILSRGLGGDREQHGGGETRLWGGYKSQHTLRAEVACLSVPGTGRGCWD